MQEILSLKNASASWENEAPTPKTKVVLTSLPDKDKWSEQFDWVMDLCLKMKKAFKKYI